MSHPHINVGSGLQPTDAARLAKIARQHAQTSKLMGVDFVPIFRSSTLIQMVEPDASAPSAIFEPKSAPLAPTLQQPDGGRDRAETQRLLDAVRARYEHDAPHQHFVTAHTTIVFGSGDPCARLMFIGEAPGAEEDKAGLPFVGRAGQLLEKMIVAMGLSREQVYITNVLKTRPPNNATPTMDEAALCEPCLSEQIRVVRPEVIVALGLPASRVLLKSDDAMARLRGRWHEWRGEGVTVPVMPTYHPAFVLRSYTPEIRGKVWSDLRIVMDRLGLAGGVAGPS
ncbi:MAG: uracil-DNA glycosylase [Phycisphaerales bacterium]|nr:uracil-DNA glycosylase [Phycisphaerales bacterium]